MKDRLRLIILARYPLPGEAKTRLAVRHGFETAAAIARRLTEHTLRQVRPLADEELVAPVVWVTPASHLALAEHWLRPSIGDSAAFRAQPDGDLGVRIGHAFDEAFRIGARAAIVIGTDCPALTTERLREAAAALDCHDAVLGPAVDGGYTLLGMTRHHPGLFVDIRWSTADVLLETERRLAATGSCVARLPPLHDVDLPGDWERAVQQFPHLRLP